MLCIVTLLWGTNWPLFRLATREVSVWTFRAVAVVIAGFTLLVVARLSGRSLVLPRRYWPTVTAGTMLYLVFWNIASTYAAVLIPSGQAAILGFTMPLWAALIGWWFLDQRLTPRLALALALGATAVGLLMWRSLPAYAQAPLGFALGLATGLAWALGTIVLKRNMPPVPAAVLTGWQLLISAVPTVIGALALGEGPWFVPSWQSIAVIGYIALVPMAIGNFAWFSIVGLLPTTLAGLSTISVPMVAMVSGALLWREPLGPTQWLAMACSATALWLALGGQRAPSADKR
jgi:drug/metabolite transporter (DMT)-like permease